MWNQRDAIYVLSKTFKDRGHRYTYFYGKWEDIYGNAAKGKNTEVRFERLVSD